ncbi:MAG TPA: class I SAM-dependent methyltransferase [Pyrinomonadaceae bacterium]|nr:class I SAM-dependent methyltransferase [Pyrinomonadaceae bacterium]
MGELKSDKELAFLQDLFIAGDWGERFASLADEHVKLPEQGRILYLGSGTGGHALALAATVGNKVKLVCVEENQESVELARAKAETLKVAVEFHSTPLNKLDFPDDQFALVIADLSLIDPERVPAIVSEVVRVANAEASVGFMLATYSSFGEFFSIYWEALHNSEISEHEGDVETLITSLPTVSQIEEIAARDGLENIQSWTQIEEFDYESGEAFLNSPLVSDFLLKGWLRSIPESWRSKVEQEISAIINEERHSAEFSLTVKATLVAGKKAAVPLVG